MNKKTVVLGASENPDRFSNKAIIALRNHGHEVIAIGKKAGRVRDVEILTALPLVGSLVERVDTVTLYLNSAHQKPYYDSILKLNPKRILFNPGTENIELQTLAEERQIEILEDCTLMMLDGKRY